LIRPDVVHLRRVDKDGNHGWTKVFGGTGNDMGTAVACGAGNVFVGGIAGVGMNLGSLSFTQAGSDDGFTAKIASECPPDSGRLSLLSSGLTRNRPCNVRMLYCKAACQ
jgi:hypothetical protein